MEQASGVQEPITQSIWKVNKFTIGNAWLIGRTNAMHSSIEKFKDEVALKIFNKIAEEFTIVKIDNSLLFGVKLFYNYLHMETISEVKATLEGMLGIVNLTTLIPKLFLVFGFSPLGSLLSISKHNIQSITYLAIFRGCNLDKD